MAKHSIAFLVVELLNRAPKVEYRSRLYIKSKNTGHLLHYQSHI